MYMLEFFLVCYFGIHFSILLFIYLRILYQTIVCWLQRFPSLWIKKKKNESSSFSLCLICLETINTVHVYQCYCKTCSFSCHYLCLKDYLRYELKCPICRQFLFERIERLDLLSPHETNY